MRFNSLRSLLSYRALLVFGIALFALSPSSLFGEDLYVNNATGDDKNSGENVALGSSNAGPLKTIGRALRIAAPGDRIIVQKSDTPYYECISLQGSRLSGVGKFPLQIVAEPGAILDGTRAVGEDAWQHVGDGVFRFQPELLHHQQLFLDNKPVDRVLPVSRGVVPELQEAQWSLVNGWIYFKVEEGRLPFQYALRYCHHQTGITLYDVDNVTISGLTVQGFQLDGINAHDTVTNCNIIGCNLRGNGRSGLSVGGASRVTVDSTIAGANGTAQIRTEGYSRLAIEGCRLLESPTSGPALVNEGGKVIVDGTEQNGDSETMATNIRNASFKLKPRPAKLQPRK